MASNQYYDSDDEKPVSRWKGILAAGEAASKKEDTQLDTSSATNPNTSAEPPLDTTAQLPITTAVKSASLDTLVTPVDATTQLPIIAAVNAAPVELDATPITKPSSEDIKEKGKEREVEKVIAINAEVYPVWHDVLPEEDIHGVKEDAEARDKDEARILQIPAFEEAPVVEAVSSVEPQAGVKEESAVSAVPIRQIEGLGNQVVLESSILGEPTIKSVPLVEKGENTQDQTMRHVLPSIETRNTHHVSTQDTQTDAVIEPPEQPHQTSQQPFVPDELDIDSASNDTDSAIADMNRTLSSTASVRSSLFDSIEENGRTYHRYKAGSYFLPNDEQEQARLDLQHHIWLLTLHGRLHLAPIGGPGASLHNVLDIATGTGVWAIDFAIKYPSASVIGTDLSPIQPLYVPQNCRFEVDDAEDEWVYSHGFDYIHLRLAVVCFRDFPSVVAKAYTALHPGGYIELQDSCLISCHDNTWDGTELKRWVLAVELAASNLGMDWQKTRKYKGWVEDAGFEEVVEQKLAQPLNPWPKGKNFKELGVWMNRNILDACDGISKAVLTRGLGMTVEEIEVLLIGVRKDVCDKRIHCYAPVHVIYARKPLDAPPAVMT